MVAAIAGCSSKHSGRNADDADTQFDKDKSLFAAIPKSDKLTLYEGLPHQEDERKALEEEKQSKETVQLHGFPFYRETLSIQDDDEKKLKELLGDENSFKPFVGGKKCGGFHPDYCVAWKIDGEEYQCLVCLGCHEVKIYSPARGLRCDIRKDAYEQIHSILKKYQKNRPPRKTE
jgi:hypothetical protein